MGLPRTPTAPSGAGIPPALSRAAQLARLSCREPKELGAEGHTECLKVRLASVHFPVYVQENSPGAPLEHLQRLAEHSLGRMSDPIKCWFSALPPEKPGQPAQHR